MSVWDKGGYVVIPVEQQHIDESLERNSSHCMTALAIASAIPDARHICVDVQCIRFTRRGLRYCFLTPHICQDNIIHFDQGERDAIKPFTLRMRPAFIAKSGKGRTHPPDDSELRGSGLTLNKVQLHLGDGEIRGRESTKMELRPQRSYPLDPDRSDGLAPPKREPDRGIVPVSPKPMRKQRELRARISTAARGDIPTTLGGRMPPVSILSRREFGLRVLRK
jgi:hypothetical protein